MEMSLSTSCSFPSVSRLSPTTSDSECLSFDILLILVLVRDVCELLNGIHVWMLTTLICVFFYPMRFEVKTLYK